MDRHPRFSAAAKVTGLLGVVAWALTACGGGTPEFSEIEEDVWTAMEEADSVTIDGGALIGQAALEEAESDPVFSDVGLDEGDEVTATVQGAVDGSAIEMDISMGEEMQVQAVQVDGSTYMDATIVTDAMALSAGDLAGDELDAEALAEEMAAELEGQWVESPGNGGLTMKDPFDGIRDVLGDRTQDLDGSTQERDGVEAHVYTNGEEGDDEVEIVVSADEEEPYLLSATYDGGTVTFSDWNETQLPEAPSESVTEVELQQLFMEHIMMGTEE